MSVASIRDLLWLTLISTTTSTIIACIGFVLTFIRKCVFVENEYRESTTPCAMRAVVERICYDCLVSERRIVHDGCMIPGGYVLCRWFCAIICTKEEGYFRNKIVTINVFRPRWMCSIVDDSAACGKDKDVRPGIVKVLRNIGSNPSSPQWSLFSEMACPNGIDGTVIKNSHAAVRRIKNAIVDNQARVIISGPPGCGKSTTARILAMELDGAVIADFNPSRPGYSIHEVVKNMQKGVIGVLVMEEVDVCLRGLDSDKDRKSEIVTSHQVTDKTSWNAMLDMLQFIPNMIVIMTTNLSFPELDAIDRAHQGALLRRGRITQRISMCESNNMNASSRSSRSSCSSRSSPANVKTKKKTKQHKRG